MDTVNTIKVVSKATLSRRDAQSGKIPVRNYLTNEIQYDTLHLEADRVSFHKYI